MGTHLHYRFDYSAGFILNNQNAMNIAMCACDNANPGYFKGRMSEVNIVNYSDDMRLIICMLYLPTPFLMSKQIVCATSVA